MGGDFVMALSETDQKTISIKGFQTIALQGHDF
jgi:hypothetical protein